MTLLGGGVEFNSAPLTLADGTTVPRSLANRGADVYNVKDFGAIGKSTDDTDAIQLAMDTATLEGRPTVIYFPKGRFVIKSPITMRPNVSIWCEQGTVIRGGTVDMDCLLYIPPTSGLTDPPIVVGVFVYGGRWDCGPNAINGFVWRNFSYCSIDNVQITGARSVIGNFCEFGNGGLTFNCQELMVRNLRLWSPNQGAGPTQLPAARGIYMSDCGESHLEDVRIIGASKGIIGNFWNSKIYNVHHWNGDLGPVVAAIECGGTGNVIVGCQADIAVIGYHFTSGGPGNVANSRNVMLGSATSYNSDFGTQSNDATSYGVKVDPGCHLSVTACNFHGDKSPDNPARHLIDIGGDLSRVHIIGGVQSAARHVAPMTETTRNWLVDGQFDLWTGGTSFAGTAASPAGAGNGTNYNNFGPTMWRVFCSSAGAGNDGASSFTKQSFNPGQALVLNSPANFIRWNRSATSTGTDSMSQRISGVSRFAGQKITFQFWMKSNAVVNPSYKVIQNYGTGGTPLSQVVAVNSGFDPTINASGTSGDGLWWPYAFEIALPATSTNAADYGTNNDDYVQFSIEFPPAIVGGTTIDITNVQVCEGFRPKAFEKVSISETLRRASSQYQVVPFSFTSEATNANIRVVNQITTPHMVKTPTATVSGLTGSGGTVTATRNATALLSGVSGSPVVGTVTVVQNAANTVNEVATVTLDARL